MYACQLCGRPNAQVGCSGCQALFYCSEKHRRLHAANGHDVDECRRMWDQLSQDGGLELHYFSWWDALNSSGNSPSPATHPLCSLLKSRGCHGQGIWKSVCTCNPFDQQHSSHVGVAEGQQGSSHGEPESRPVKRAKQDRQAGQHSASGSIGTTAPYLQTSPWLDATELSPLGQAHNALEFGTLPAVVGGSLGSWQQYYHRAGLNADSIAALALHFALTTHFAIDAINRLCDGAFLSSSTRCQAAVATAGVAGPGGLTLDTAAACSAAAALASEQPSISCQRLVHVIYAGPQAELGMLPTFGELLRLLPSHVSLFIHFVGPDVPPSGSTLSGTGTNRAEISACHGCEACIAWPSAGVATQRGTQALTQDHSQAASGCGEGPPPADDSTVVRADNSTSSSTVASGQEAAAWGPAAAGAQERCLRFSFWHGLLHELEIPLLNRYGMTADNTLVIMPNAGLAAYTSWVPTMQRLLCHCPSPAKAAPEGNTANSLPSPVNAYSLRGMPCFVTDYCAEALHKAQAMLQALCHIRSDSTQIAANPFRQPHRQTLQGNALPSYSNGFYMTLNT